MAMTFTRSFLVLLFVSLLSLFPLVLTVPHNVHHPRFHDQGTTSAWLRDQAAQVEQARRDEICPNNPWLDYSVKVRGDAAVIHDSAACDPIHGLDSLRKRDEYSCDEATPCSNGACCGKSGFCGYGSTYCGDGTTPNDDCWSNCDAKAECGKDSSPANTTCPLNACCSQYGFCGTTTDFCDTLCQSNCIMPDGSGVSGGDVQSRIVGYYEGWKVADNCAALNLGMKNIPLGSLTHLIVAFGYITPGDFNVEPMPGVSEDTFSGFTALKETNPSTKIMVSLGGWSFTDNDTDTQEVYTTMVSSHDNRAAFIVNLLAFLSHYGFDGVDFDWEYPGATDRGGNTGDAQGYLDLLVQLRVAMDLGEKTYEVSFTTPTSFYYLRNYAVSGDTYESNLKLMTEYADMVNVMSYDLHGTWDGPKDKIGSIVLAHTNLTEIETAFDLFWRIGVDPAKLNLGVGFYGRTYQLSDPSCYQPGCPFSGGADAGTCTGQSGILSYKEIMDIIALDDITPVWDEVAAVKYITWKDDQWASFDDETTFQQKIKWANAQGIGGLAIWAIDLDTDDLQALQGLLYPKSLNAFYDNTTDSSGDWESVQGGECHLTDCNSKCVAGEVKIVEQKCNDQYGKTGTSQLCCPVASAPDPSTCTWRGNPTSCNGRCHENEVALEQNPWGGGGDKCTDGNKVYCCALPDSLQSNCRMTDCGGSCNDDENSIAGEFYDNCWFDPMQLCCPKESPYQADVCHWQGKDGSCYDNVCAFNTEVQLTQSYDGGDGDCGIQLSRDRVFCCTAPGGVQPFLPVPLEYLFASPPTGDDVDAEFKLSVDDTWGTTSELGDDATPNDASFGFFVMTSPQELQTSLRKRDGSHWDLFDCDATAVHEEAQTIRMFCNDDSPASNCHKIFLGHGVPGTILDMPRGCGPGPYAVAIEMVESQNQTIPGHIRKRTSDPSPVVYDLTFDYDFRRVPRDDSGESSTQWRLDYSNEEGYWDTVVDSPGQKRRKRSFEEHGGSHKRYLEDSWHADLADHHAGLISRDELHARWFGSDAIAWLKNIFTVSVDTPPFVHTVNEVLNVILLDETYQCTINNVDVAAKLLVQAQLEVSVDTQFGMTIVATLGQPIDLGGSYLWFKNAGTVQALFSIEALVSAHYDTGDIELFGLQNFGATFSIPGILTVGPNFKLFGSVNFDLSLSGSFEAHVTIAEWDTQLAFPEAETDANPKDTTDPETTGTQNVLSPTIDWSIDANGQITAHVKPVISFGLTFNSLFVDVKPATVNLVADGYVTAYASATYGSDDQDFCYGANAGADLYVQLSVPDNMKWVLPNSKSIYSLWSSPTYGIIEKTCSSDPPSTTGSAKIKRSIDGREEWATIDSSSLVSLRGPATSGHEIISLDGALYKRSVTLGPLVRVPTLSCPNTADDAGASSGNISGCPLCGENDATDTDSSLLLGRWGGRLTTRDDGDDDEEACELPDAYGEDQVSCTWSGYSLKRGVDALSGDYTGEAWWVEDQDANHTSKPLEKRLSPKTVPVTFGGYTYTLDVGNYKACGEAQGDSAIDKTFLFANSRASCIPTMVKLTNAQAKADVPGFKFETDHVFEAQTLKAFLLWLVDGGTLPTGWTKPSVDWVASVIMGNDQVGQTFSLVSTQIKTPTLANGGAIPITAMAYGFGRSDGKFAEARLTVAQTQKNLALAWEDINGIKGVWFGGGSPAVTGTGKKNLQQKIRNSAGVFRYLAYVPPTGEPIWNKWMRVSNWIDLVCWTFDQQYNWAAAPAGAPTGRAGGAGGTQGSLRSLYARFIDAHLASIEATAGVWGTQAMTDYNNDYPTTSDTAPNRAWFASAFAAGTGWATANAAGLRFPRVAAGAGASVYGAYANAQMTFDGTNTGGVALGAPTVIQ